VVGFKKSSSIGRCLNQGTHLLQLRGQLKNELDHLQGRVAEGDQNEDLGPHEALIPQIPAKNQNKSKGG
jgi:hypothetical protein